MDERLWAKIRKVKLLMMDVDGVLTDGRIIIDDAGLESKHFHVRDGHGLKMVMRIKVGVALVTGRTSKVVAHRAADLGIVEVHQGIKNKAEVLPGILEKFHLAAEETAYIGDDLVDIPLLRRVGFSVAVADAIPEVRGVADYVTKQGGGQGAVREVCDMILKAQDHWGEVVARYELA
ncbi:MAG: HAD-IIIA family hydrolase [Deltaproteobacteria bacterium]|nr:HAD-IIIA family hydrolase [Deltaproteobacteria bacterium]